jgi:isochorismate synthase
MESIELIKEHEVHQRGLYTGIIGFYAEQNCSLYVNLRCAQIQKENAYLYLGGGFTKDSDIEKEWEETENKSMTLISIMQNIT